MPRQKDLFYRGDALLKAISKSDLSDDAKKIAKQAIKAVKPSDVVERSSHDFGALIQRVTNFLKSTYGSDEQYSDMKLAYPDVEFSYSGGHVSLDSIKVYFDGGYSALVVTESGIRSEEYGHNTVRHSLLSFQGGWSFFDKY